MQLPLDAMKRSLNRRARQICWVAIAALSLGAASVYAQPAYPAQMIVDRQPTELVRPATQLFATPTGALFAATPTGVFRSDDSAATWQPAPLPDRPPQTTLRLVAVDAGGRTVAYAGPADKALLRSDGGAWVPVNLPDTESHVVTLVASPADPNLLYALTSGPWPPTNVPVRLYRSRDAGATWQVIDKPCGPEGTDGHALFAAGGWIQPDAVDPLRVFRTTNCSGSIGGGAPRTPYVDESRDQGQTWTEFFRGGQRGTPPMAGDALRLVGHSLASPGIFLVAVRNDFRQGGSRIFRSADDGKSWQSTLEFEGGVASGNAYLIDLPNISDPGALGFDPSHPEQIVVGGAWVSADGGQGWGSVGVVRLSVRRMGSNLADAWQVLPTDQPLARPVGLTLTTTSGGTSGLFVSYAGGRGGVLTLALDGSHVAEWTPLRAAGVAVTPDGQSLFASDQAYPFAVRQLLPDGATVLDNFKQTPQGLAVDSSGRLYVSLHSSGRLAAVHLMQLSIAGDILSQWSDTGADPGQFGDSVWAVALDSANNMYVADTLNDRVQELAADGTPMATWGDWGTDLGHFRFPMGVAVDSASGTIYVADTFNDRLVAIVPAGAAALHGLADAVQCAETSQPQ